MVFLLICMSMHDLLSQGSRDPPILAIATQELKALGPYADRVTRPNKRRAWPGTTNIKLDLQINDIQCCINVFRLEQ